MDSGRFTASPSRRPRQSCCSSYSFGSALTRTTPFVSEPAGQSSPAEGFSWPCGLHVRHTMDGPTRAPLVMQAPLRSLLYKGVVFPSSFRPVSLFFLLFCILLQLHLHPHLIRLLLFLLSPLKKERLVVIYPLFVLSPFYTQPHITHTPVKP